MNIRLKLLFPLIVGYALLAILLHFIWVPLLLTDAEKKYKINENLFFSSMESEVIRHIISGDIASLHNHLDSHMSLHAHDWKKIELYDNNGDLIYPFENIKIEKNKNIIETLHEITFLGTKLGVLSVVVDWSIEKNHLIKRFRQLELYLLMVFGLIIVLSMIWQSFKVSKPIKLLIASISQYASGDTEVVIPYLGKDEIGDLAIAFNNMIKLRLIYDDEMKQLTRKTEMAYSELTEQKFILDQHAIVTITDLEGNITYANEKFFLISGYDHGEIIGKNHRIIKSSHHDNVFFTDLYNAVKHGEMWHDEICNKSKNGDLFWVDTTIAPFLSQDGQPQSYIAIHTDISKRKKTELDLIRSKEVAEEAVRAKSDFLASMSHEIRTPMNGVLGMLGLLENTDLDKQQQHRIMLAKSSAQSLLSLINDILDFSKVDAGKMILEPIDFNLRTMLGELAETMVHQVKDKNIELILDIKGIEQTMVLGDPGRIRQIITNIISNAIKFTSQGEIIVKASLQMIDEQEWQFNCSISDTGIGIPADKISILFDSFSQVDSSTTRVYGGTGLGLAIVKKLCELMSGSIHVSSELDKGSCFDLKLRLQKSQRSQQVLPNYDISDLNLLIVDDNLTNREVLKAQLEHWGATVTETDSGQQALHLCEQQYKESNLFDIAFLDMQMPEMDGAQLGTLLRQNTHLNSMKLIMMTSMGYMGDAKYFSELGFSGYFPKPATTSDLFDALLVVAEDGDALKQAKPLVTHHYLKSLIHDDEETGNNQHVWAENTRILLVEDNKVNQLVASGIIQNFGLKVKVAENGTEAISLLNESTTNIPFTLILMDCQMPVMDGYEATRQIRLGSAGLKYKIIPIIAMTANAMIGDKEKCLNAGMSDYLTKPIEPELLLEKLQYWSKFESVLSSNEAANDTLAETAYTINLKIWDQPSALKRLAGNEKLFKQLLVVYFVEHPQRLAELQQAVVRNDNEQAYFLAHTIKGVAATLGGLILQDRAALIEQAAKQNNMIQVKLLLPELLEYSEELKESFIGYLNDN